MSVSSALKEVETPAQRSWPQDVLESLPKKSPDFISSIFDLTEFRDCYVLAIDLPALPHPECTIELKKGEIRIGAGYPMSLGPKMGNNMLFRCRSSGARIRSVYLEGVLWVLLPKTESAEALMLDPTLPTIENIKVLRSI